MSLSLFLTSGRVDRMRAELLHSALPYSRSCQRSGRSPALPYPLHELLHFTILPGGLIFEINMGSISLLISAILCSSGCIFDIKVVPFSILINIYLTNFTWIFHYLYNTSITK